MQVDATTITRVCKNRWHVELFFKWIKQHLHNKRFHGRSDNAVRSQIWIAMCVYHLILMLKKRLVVEYTAYEILQILSVTILLKEPLFSLFLKDFTLFINPITLTKCYCSTYDWTLVITTLQTPRISCLHGQSLRSFVRSIFFVTSTIWPYRPGLSWHESRFIVFFRPI